MNTEKTIDALNTLIEINNDRIEGYETATNETEDADLKTLFAKFIHTSQKCKAELVNEVQKLGGTATEGTKTTGKIFRIWMDFKALVTGKDRKGILNSCEFGEDAAVDTYTKVLRTHLEDISAELLTILNAQHILIKADHNMVKAERDMLVIKE